ncbi:FAST kinase domain-containing protein 3, mitochondrial [Sorex fumeus]|uniref:FAST kinase domain-containing protein 3, mitochondrial n=1 Tax=Sorex fumeus TaxID=62283 RepID=UPI0024AD326A|nr:FAST kinase domain-containing protein 3, mitochondrial [Sorex fumeus]
MALITLRRTLAQQPGLGLRVAAWALTDPPVSGLHRVAAIPPSRPESFRVRFHHACCQKFHSENGHDPGGSSPSAVQDPDTMPQDVHSMDTQLFHQRLDSCSTSGEVLRFLGPLPTLPDTLAASALQRICELEREAGERTDGVLPGQVLESHVFHTLCESFQRAPASLSDHGLLTALQALALLCEGPQSAKSGLLLDLLAEAQRRLQGGTLGVRSLCVLGENLVKLSGPGCATLELIIHQLQAEKLEEFTPEDVVALYCILQGCSEKLDQHQPFLNRVNSFALSIVCQLSPTQISQMLTALVVLDQTQALPLVIKLGKGVVRHIPRFTDAELGRVLEAFIHFGHSDRFFTEGLERHVASRSLSLDPEVLGKILGYCSQKRILSTPILDAAADTLLCQAEKLSPAQVCDFIEPLGKLNYVPPNASALFRKLENRLLSQFKSFPPKTLLKLLHSCSLLEFHPVNFMAKIFSPYFLQQLQGGDPHLDRLALARLTQLFLTSLLECPFYKGPRLLPKFRVKSLLTPCCSLESPVEFPLYKSVMLGLIELLGARWYFASKVLSPYCYTLDVEIKLDEEGFVLPFTVNEDIHKRIALCIDGPKRFCVNSRHLLGAEATKQRHLRLLGYQVVQIPFYEIEMLKSRFELVDYLQRKLFPQRTGVHW